VKQPKHAAEPIPDRFVPTLRRGPYNSTPSGKKLLKAFEKGCDEAELEKGRRLARRGVVTRFQIKPGIMTAEITGETASTIRVVVRVELASKRLQDAVIKMAAAESGASGDFLNRRVSSALLAEVGEERLIPSPGQIEVRCTHCPEAKHCRHMMAVQALFIDFLNEDALLLLRWRGFGQYAEDDLGDWPSDTEPVLDLLRERRGCGRPVGSVAAVDLAWNQLGEVDALPEAPEPEEKPIVEQLGLPPFFPESERNLLATLRRLQEDA
jgi:hypothetical protein